MRRIIYTNFLKLRANVGMDSRPSREFLFSSDEEEIFAVFTAKENEGFCMTSFMRLCFEIPSRKWVLISGDVIVPVLIGLLIITVQFVGVCSL